MTHSEKHNELATSFVRTVGHGTHTSAEICVVLESIILGAMWLMNRLHGAKPHVAVGLVEAAVQRAVVRFSEPTQ